MNVSNIFKNKLPMPTVELEKDIVSSTSADTSNDTTQEDISTNTDNDAESEAISNNVQEDISSSAADNAEDKEILTEEQSITESEVTEEATEMTTEEQSITESEVTEEATEVTTEEQSITESEVTEEATETSIETVTDTDVNNTELLLLVQEQNAILEKQYMVTSTYLNILTFTLLTVYVIGSIKKSVNRFSRTKEK